MIKVEMLVGIPGSGKSTHAKSIVAKDPDNWVRINNDDLRAMMNGSVWSAEYEKMVTDARNFMIKEALKKGKNVIIDNLNLNRRHFDDVCKIAKSARKDIQVFEKVFFIELDEAIERDSKREGKAQVGEAVIRKWWKESGGKQFKFYKPRVEILMATHGSARDVEPMVQDENLPRAVIFDNDGTISLLNGRNPYDASTCDEDAPHKHVIECMKLYFKAGYKILFVSGREEKDRAPTERFYQKYFPEVTYELFMRPTANMEKDVVIKERIFNENIKDKYFVAGWFDDRLQVSRWVHDSGLPLFRVNDPEATFLRIVMKKPESPLYSGKYIRCPEVEVTNLWKKTYVHPDCTDQYEDILLDESDCDEEEKVHSKDFEEWWYDTEVMSLQDIMNLLPPNSDPKNVIISIHRDREIRHINVKLSLNSEFDSEKWKAEQAAEEKDFQERLALYNKQLDEYNIWKTENDILELEKTLANLKKKS